MHPDMKKDVSQATPQKGSSPTRLAGGLLIGMGAVATGTTYLAARHFHDDSLALGVLRAGSRAGVVGGLADWFAVTALFRHPMGLPIPHTAILPRQKVRLGQALGRFVSGQFYGCRRSSGPLQD